MMSNPENPRETVTLTADELAMIDAATPYEAGKGYTREQVLERARQAAKAG